MGDNFYRLVKRLLIVGLILWLLYSGGKAAAIIFTADDDPGSSEHRNKAGRVNMWLGISFAFLTVFCFLCTMPSFLFFLWALVLDLLACIILSLFYPILQGVVLFFREIFQTHHQPMTLQENRVDQKPEEDEEIENYTSSLTRQQVEEKYQAYKLERQLSERYENDLQNMTPDERKAYENDDLSTMLQYYLGGDWNKATPIPLRDEHFDSTFRKWKLFRYAQRNNLSLHGTNIRPV